MLLSLSSCIVFPSHSHRRRPVCLGSNGAAVCLAHSSARFLKSSRRPRLGRRAPTYGVDDEEAEDEESEEEEYELIEDDVPEIDHFGRNQYSNKRKLNINLEATNGAASGIKMPSQKGWKAELKDGYATKSSIGLDSKDPENCGKFSKKMIQKLIEELDFDEKWLPLIDYLSTFGLKESHFISIYERHMPSLQINLLSAKERLTFLIGIGVKRRDIKRILVRQPQILEYTVENNMMSHVRFLLGIGIPSSRIGQIIAAAPSIFSYSIEHSLKPKIRYLVEEIGIKGGDVSKVVQLSPHILVQKVDNSWNSRSSFLSKELGASRDSIVKMVTKHPQLLHYSIEDGISPRINFLRSIGMRNSDIVKVLTSLTQVLSLSLEENLKPKYRYLVNELRNEVQSLVKYPTYLSLSLNQRIRPRHRFLVSLKKAPKGPFPLSTFVPTDESFCQQWAGTSLDKYLAFRQSLLLSEFANKYSKNR